MNTLTEAELQSTNGGLTLVETVVAALVVLVATNIVNNWDHFTAGLAGEPNPTRNAAK
jgi:hypothetical protein